MIDVLRWRKIEILGEGLVYKRVQLSLIKNEGLVGGRHLSVTALEASGYK